MKKKLLALLVIGFAVVGSSCNKIKDATDQNITLTGADVTFTVTPKATSDAVVVLNSQIITADLDALIKKEAPSFSLKNLKSLKIKTLTAEITAGADANNSFANLNEIAAVIEATGKTPFTATYSSSSTTKIDKINFTVNNSVDLKDLLSSGTLNYTLKSKVRSATDKNLTVKVVSTYDAVVGL
ncbi:hypothetical protein D3C87_106880 [compost metagenome]